MHAQAIPTAVEDNDLLPLSALQHLMFCERQCALIHLEQLWEENRFTAEGRVMHERVHENDSESRGDLRIARGLRIRSLELGLIGQADVVEFHRMPSGSEQPFPVEFKRGRPKPDECDEVQLCAQAMCLEEMLHATIPQGAIFYGKPRRRHPVTFSDALRNTTRQTAQRLHHLIQQGVTPPAVYVKKKCEACSLFNLCKPELQTHPGSVHRYIQRMVLP
jgi:CRISPR-associated exonuclease Cas4